jgi:tetratricopeptide (TPR) repeat protein
MSRRLALAAGLFVLAVAPFASSVSFGLVWDDRALVEENPVVSRQAGIGEAFTHELFWGQPERTGANRFYRPGLLLYFRVLAAFGRGPVLLHAGSLLLHGVTALLLFHLLSRRAGPVPSFLGAAFFAVHPLRVESVVWVAGAGDILCAALLLASLATHLADLDRPRPWLRTVSLLAFVGALLVKEAAALFPAFLALEALACASRDRRRVALVLPYAALAAGFWLMRGRVLGPASAPEPIVASAPELVLRYLGALAVPWPHRINASYEPVPTLLDARFLIPGLVLAAAGLALVLLPRVTRRRLLGPIGWILIFLLPVCLFRTTVSVFAERYTYLPALGFSAVILALLDTARGPLAHLTFFRSARIAAALGLAGVLALAGLAASRTAVWRDDQSLAQARLAQRPDDAGALLMLAAFALNRGDAAGAEPLYRDVTALTPGDPNGWYGLGVASAILGRPQEARAHLERSLALGVSTSTLNALANVTLSLGQADEALVLYRRALEASPWNLQARFNLGLLLARLGRCGEARSAFTDVARRGTGPSAALARQAVAQLGGLRAQELAGGCR